MTPLGIAVRERHYGHVLLANVSPLMLSYVVRFGRVF